ncbi:MAG: DUF4347 domain-containing protein, partial [Synechococcus sp. YX04-3]
MDTDGYVYPPMDDLLKRQNAGGQGGFDPNSSDGGDLNGGDGLHPRPGESDVGSGLELDRSLQRVAAHEAWLNEQSQLPVENWLQIRGGKQISLENFGVSSNSADFTQADSDRSLVVVDSRSNQWEELSRDLSDNTDLLVLDDRRGGIEQLKDFLGSQDLNSPYSRISLIGSADGDIVSFGSQELDTSEFCQQVSLIQQSELINNYASLSLYTAPHADLNAVSVSILDSASEFLDVARSLLLEASTNGSLKLAANAAFAVDKYDLVESRLKEFLSGELSPTIEWVNFESDFVRGAYLTGESRILLSRSLANDRASLENVLLEEFGHWLDDVTSEDSQGDEGYVFAAFLAGHGPQRSSENDQYKVNIDGVIFAAEFAAGTVSGASDTLAFTEGGSAAVIDSTLTVADGDSSDQYGAWVEIISGYVEGEDVLTFSNTGNITGTWESGRGILWLNGQDTNANYELALESVKFQNTNTSNPDTTNRTVQWAVYDGADWTASPATSTITVAGVNDAPTGADAGATLAFSEGDAATVIDSTLTLADVDDTNLESATVQITGNFQTGEDVLG